MSYLEIYNDAGYDLLDPAREIHGFEDLPRVTVFEDASSGVSLRNLSLHVAADEEAALNLVSCASAHSPWGLESFSLSTCLIESRFAQDSQLLCDVGAAQGVSSATSAGTPFALRAQARPATHAVAACHLKQSGRGPHCSAQLHSSGIQTCPDTEMLPQDLLAGPQLRCLMFHMIPRLCLHFAPHARAPGHDSCALAALHGGHQPRHQRDAHEPGLLALPLHLHLPHRGPPGVHAMAAGFQSYPILCPHPRLRIRGLPTNPGLFDQLQYLGRDPLLACTISTVEPAVHRAHCCPC